MLNSTPRNGVVLTGEKSVFLLICICKLACFYLYFCDFWCLVIRKIKHWLCQHAFLSSHAATRSPFTPGGHTMPPASKYELSVLRGPHKINILQKPIKNTYFKTILTVTQYSLDYLSEIQQGQRLLDFSWGVIPQAKFYYKEVLSCVVTSVSPWGSRTCSKAFIANFRS